MLATLAILDIPNFWDSLSLSFWEQQFIVLGPTEKKVTTDKSHNPGYPKTTSKNLFLLNPVDLRIQRKEKIALGMKFNVKAIKVPSTALTHKQKNMNEYVAIRDFKIKELYKVM